MYLIHTKQSKEFFKKYLIMIKEYIPPTHFPHPHIESEEKLHVLNGIEALSGCPLYDWASRLSPSLSELSVIIA